MKMKGKQLRDTIKEEFLNHNFKNAIKEALKHASDKDIKNNLHQQLNEIDAIKERLKKREISNEDYYYGMNKIVMETLSAIDNIVGDTDEDWDFIDELTSSLKYNLVDQDESDIYNSQVEIVKTKEDGKVVFEFEMDKKEKGENFELLKKLYQELNYYERKEEETENTEEKEKIHNIIDAIKNRISQVNASTME